MLGGGARKLLRVSFKPDEKLFSSNFIWSERNCNQRQSDCQLIFTKLAILSWLLPVLSSSGTRDGTAGDNDRKRRPNTDKDEQRQTKINKDRQRQ